MIDKLYFLKTHFYLTIILAFISLVYLEGCSKYSEEVQTNLTKLKTTKSCQGCDLTGIELVGFDLKGGDLSGSNLAEIEQALIDLVDGANAAEAASRFDIETDLGVVAAIYCDEHAGSASLGQPAHIEGHGLKLAFLYLAALLRARGEQENARR